ncbi:MAG: rod shape-determining protein MreC [Ornithinimicrobium sp.]
MSDVGKRIVAALIAVTVLLLLVDVARPAWTAPLRSAGAAAFTPVQQALRGWDQDELDDARAEQDRLEVEVEQLRAELEAEQRASRIEVPSGVRGEVLVRSRVVASSPSTSPVGSRILTLDAGERDGVQEDRTVLNADGLVGRVLSTTPTSSQVLLLGDPRVVVGVRFGPEGVLGSVSASAPPGLPARDDGALTLTGIGDTPINVGDEVRTLGSPDDTPFVPDVLVGTVVAVDPDAGQLGATAVMQPAVDVATLDAVIVLATAESR